MKAQILVDQEIILDHRFKAVIRVYQVSISSKFPDGIKSRYVLIDMLSCKAVLLFDNHEPFGFHWHPDPENSTLRVCLATNQYRMALELFWKKVEEIRHGIVTREISDT